MALTEQQNHLQQVVEQQKTLVAEIQSLNSQVENKRNMATKLQGIAEYLDGLGVKLPTEEETAAETEAAPAAAETEVVAPES
tara:strand:- start:5542 stop:5787 length:246 start_codon:yes stop_codon:yes gene_type:complete